MEQYTPIERAQIVELYIKNNYSIVKTQREFRAKNLVRSAPAKNTIKSIYQKFRNTGTVSNARRPNRTRTMRSDQNIERVRASVERSPTTSSRRRSLELGLSDRTLRRIVRVDLHMYPYKIQITQKILPADKPRRLAYANFVINMAQTEVGFWRNIIMSDEAHFMLSGAVNKHNSRYYATENPEIIHEEPLHDQKVSVWCGIYAGGIIGPYFFENSRGKAVTVNGPRYREMITDFLQQELQDRELNNYWFQQDGATAHTAAETIDLLKPMFPNRLISKNGDFDWPPRSPDLTAPDFFLWGYLKSKVYTNKPKSTRAFKRNIQREIARIPAEMIEKTMENAEKRAHSCVRAHGGHLKDIIFRH